MTRKTHVAIACLALSTLACENSEITKAKSTQIDNNFTAAQQLDYKEYCDDNKWELKQDKYDRNYIMHTCITRFDQQFIDMLVSKHSFGHKTLISGIERDRNQLVRDLKELENIESYWVDFNECRTKNPDNGSSRYKDYDPCEPQAWRLKQNVTPLMIMTGTSDYYAAAAVISKQINQNISYLDSDMIVANDYLQKYENYLHDTYSLKDKYYRISYLQQAPSGKYHLVEDFKIMDDHGNEAINPPQIPIFRNQFYSGKSRESLAMAFASTTKVREWRTKDFSDWHSEIMAELCDEQGNQKCPYSGVFMEGVTSLSEMIRKADY